MIVQAKINAAVVTCLEHVATSTSPPGAAAGDFLLRLLDDEAFTVDEVDEISMRVGVIIRGIIDRADLTRPRFFEPVSNE
jgi:hypothetical protein